VEILAKKAGIEIPRRDEESGGVKRETFLELYRGVAKSFHYFLAESPQGEGARRYLEGRGVSAETVERFQLGFAPSDRRWLHRFLSQKSYSKEFLSLTGLFMENARGGGSAFFANRIMFPIANNRGEILAFGGRSLGEEHPKYLNSPETAFFRKGENLFGIEKAVPAIRGESFFFLVEGYMDVLAMHQAGLVNCVAPLGTALTERQSRLLKRFASKAVLVFDGDDAGEKATARAVEILEGLDFIVQVVELPKGRDPADFLMMGDPGALRGIVSDPRDSFRYLAEKALSRNDRSRPEGREQIRDFLFPFIAAVASQVRADGYLKFLAGALDADGEAVARDYAAWKGARRTRIGPARGMGEEAIAVSSDLFLMLAVAANRELFPLVRTGGIALADLEDERAKVLYIALEESYRAEEASFDALCARIEDNALRDMTARRAASGEFEMNPRQMVADGVKRIRQRSLRKRIEALGAEMRKAEREKPDPARMRELLAEKMHLDGELARLNTRAAGA
jgi:DNA primase